MTKEELEVLLGLLKKSTPGPVYIIRDDECHPDHEVFSSTKKMDGGNPCPIASFEWEADEALFIALRNSAGFLIRAALDNSKLRLALEDAIEIIDLYARLPKHIARPAEELGIFFDSEVETSK